MYCTVVKAGSYPNDPIVDIFFLGEGGGTICENQNEIGQKARGACPFVRPKGKQDTMYLKKYI